MAGKPKRGLDYFPIDIGFYDKPQIIRLRNKYESMGVDAYLYLLKTIFSQGQFIDETDLECTIINLANHLRTEETKAEEIVRYMSRSICSTKASSPTEILLPFILRKPITGPLREGRKG